jgi:hypothetical protein
MLIIQPSEITDFMDEIIGRMRWGSIGVVISNHGKILSVGFPSKDLGEPIRFGQSQH